MPRPFKTIPLQQYRNDIYAINAERRALLRSALSLLRVDPIGALHVFPVHLDRSEGWDQYVLVFPEARGELVYEVDELERIVVLREVLWRWTAACPAAACPAGACQLLCGHRLPASPTRAP